MKTCKTCVFRQLDAFSRSGWDMDENMDVVAKRYYCSNPMLTDGGFAKEMLTHGDHDGDLFYVGEDFGCIHHQSVAVHNWEPVNIGLYDTVHECSFCKKRHLVQIDDKETKLPLYGCEGDKL